MHIEIFARNDLGHTRGKTSRVTDVNIAVEVEGDHLHIKANQSELTREGTGTVFGDPSTIIERDAYILLTRDDILKIIATAVESGFITSIPLRLNVEK